jgi:flagellar hook-length control protein FliK
MTTDRTAPARPAALAERPANGPRKQEQAPDVFAQILGAKAPADQPKRADAARDGGHAHKAGAKDQAADDAAKPAADQANAVADPNAVVTPDAPVPPAEPLPVTAEQLVAQLTSPLPAPPQQPGEQPGAPIQAPVNAVQAATQAPAQPVVTPQPAQAPVATAPQQPAQAPAEPTTAPTDPTAETPVPAAPIKTDDVKLPQAPLAAAPHAQSAAPTGAPAQPNAGDTGRQPSQQQPEQTAAPAPTPSTAHVAEAPKVEAPADPQPVQGAPVAPVQAATAAQRAVPLYRAPHVAAAVIHLAQQHGVTHARINLKPAELGGIEVRLHSSPQGISAHLVADSPEAAKALHQASDDLRRQLESRDVTLLSLDVSTSNGDDGRPAGFGADAGRDGGPSTPGGRYGSRESEQPADAPAETTLVLPDGVLVDVLA